VSPAQPATPLVTNFHSGSGSGVGSLERPVSARCLVSTGNLDAGGSGGPMLIALDSLVATTRRTIAAGTSLKSGRTVPL
jgi:hypothetical protein